MRKRRPSHPTIASNALGGEGAFGVFAAVRGGCWVSPAGGGVQAAPLVLSTGVVEPYTTRSRQGFLDRLVATAFKDLGYDVRIEVYEGASERGLRNANEGIDDGQVLRVAGLEKRYPNLIRVPEPVMLNDFVLMSKRQVFKVSGWQSLRPYTVGYLLGWKVFEANIPKGVSTTSVRQAPQLFDLLAKDRVDVALYERWQAVAHAASSGHAVQIMDPPLETKPMYMYLHSKHAALVPKVSAALVQLKRNGQYQLLYDEMLRPLQTGAHTR